MKNKYLDNGPQHSEGLKSAILAAYGNITDCSLEFKDAKGVYAKFPFFNVKSRLFGNRVISVPFVDVGGVCGSLKSGDLNELKTKSQFPSEVINVKIDKSLKNFKKLKSELLNQGFFEKTNNHQFVLKLKSKDELWKQFHKHTRNDIRKSIKSGLRLERIDSLVKVKNFYGLYLKEMHRFGTPQHSLSFFKELYANNDIGFFGFNCYSGEKIIGSIIVLYSGKRGLVFVNVSNPSFRDMRPNDLLYWETLQSSIKEEIEYLDLGQVNIGSEKGSREWSLYKFKKKWLAEPYSCSIFISPHEIASCKSKGSKMKLLRKIWSKLPLFIVKIIGPKIRSGLAI